MAKEIAVSPYFLDTAHGKLFVIDYSLPKPSDVTGTVIIVPPFAEEMNLSRKMMSMQARDLAVNGIRTILVDLYGTGDSGGDFSDAGWSVWCENIRSVLLSMDETSRESVGFLAIRTGALVLFDSQSVLASYGHKIALWNPCVRGAAFLRQFLRIRIASQMSEGNTEKETIAELMEKFENGESVEVAGYEISADLAKSIELASLGLEDSRNLPPICWMEVVPESDAPLPVASSTAIDYLRRQNIAVSLMSVPGEKFWGTVETATVPDLIEATTTWFVEE